MAARCFNPIMAVFAHRKGALHVAANCENVSRHEHTCLPEAPKRLTLRWRTAAAVRHNMAWRRIWFCLCLCLCRCLDLCASAASVVLCPPLLLKCCALTLASQPSLQDVSRWANQWRGESGQRPTVRIIRGEDGGEAGTPWGRERRGAQRKATENVGGRRPARGRGRHGGGKNNNGGTAPAAGQGTRAVLANRWAKLFFLRIISFRQNIGRDIYVYAFFRGK